MQPTIEVATMRLACHTAAILCPLYSHGFAKQFGRGFLPGPGIVFACPCYRSCYHFSVVIVQSAFANHSHAVSLVDAATISLIAAMQRTVYLIASVIMLFMAVLFGEAVLSA